MPPNMQEIKNINIYLMFLYILHDSNIDIERPPCIDHFPNEKNMEKPIISRGQKAMEVA
jgi:hypothetical protein